MLHGIIPIWNVFCHICHMRISLLVILLLPFLSKGQTYFKDHFGGTVGLVVNVGSHVTSTGINIKGYYTDYFAQINAGSTFYLHNSSYGGRKRFWENRNSIGLVLMGGKRDSQIDFQLDGLNHQTAYNYGIGFNYLFYFDNKGTSQTSGGFGFHIKELSIYHENDVFAGNAKDRFRTGHLYASYLWNDFKFGTGINLWTGDSQQTYWQKITFDGCPAGFKVLEDNPYGKTSHGNVYGSVIYNLPYGQDMHLKIGYDSEQARHIVQNRIIHDIGRFVGRSAPQYPRLNEHGCIVFDKDDVRPTKAFIQLGMNDNWSN